jgi:hypothetical protein
MKSFYHNYNKNNNYNDDVKEKRGVEIITE